VADADVRFEKLRALARLYADQRPGTDTGFVPDSNVSLEVGSVDDLVNLACAEFYDLLVEAGGERAASKDQTVSVLSGTSTYNLATDVYRILSVVLEWGVNDHEPVGEVSEPERPFFTNTSTWGRWTPKGYQRRGPTPTGAADLPAILEFFPKPASAVTARVRYVPTFKRLVETNFFNAVSGWEKLIALKVAIELRAISSEPTQDLWALFNPELERIQAMADKRSNYATPQVVDIERLGFPQEWLADRRWMS